MNKKILIVDDDESLRELIIMRLQKSDFKIAEASNGQEALDQLPQFQPDLILMDIMMPVMDGFQACQKIREQREFSEIPIIFLTAHNEDWDMLTGFSKGCDSYLTKPVDFNVLLKEIDKILN